MSAQRMLQMSDKEFAKYDRGLEPRRLTPQRLLNMSDAEFDWAIRKLDPQSLQQLLGC
jgi:hypothetical protein